MGEEISPFAPPRSNLEGGVANATQQPLAGRGARFVAVLLDGLIMAPAMIIGSVAGKTVVGPALMILLLLGIGCYQIYLLSTTGQTLGKKWMKVRVVKLDGSNPGFVTVFVMRALVNGLLGIIPLYGLVDALFIFSEDQRCIHDKIAGTRVVVA